MYSKLKPYMYIKPVEHCYSCIIMNHVGIVVEVNLPNAAIAKR